MGWAGGWERSTGEAPAAEITAVAPVFKALEHRPDGLFLAEDERSELPALLLEAQMAANAHFFLRLYAESGRFLLQEKQSATG